MYAYLSFVFAPNDSTGLLRNSPGVFVAIIFGVFGIWHLACAFLPRMPRWAFWTAPVFDLISLTFLAWLISKLSEG